MRNATGLATSAIAALTEKTTEELKAMKLTEAEIKDLATISSAMEQVGPEVIADLIRSPGAGAVKSIIANAALSGEDGQKLWSNVVKNGRHASSLKNEKLSKQ